MAVSSRALRLILNAPHKDFVAHYLNLPAFEGRRRRAAENVSLAVEKGIMAGAMELLLLRVPNDCASHVGADEGERPQAPILFRNQDPRGSSILE